MSKRTAVSVRLPKKTLERMDAIWERSGMTKSEQVRRALISDSTQCVGDSHIWNAEFTSGDTCQCGDLYLSRNGDGWEVRIR